MTRTSDRTWVYIGLIAALVVIGPKLIGPLWALSFGLLKVGLLVLGVYALITLIRRSNRMQPVASLPVTPAVASASPVQVDPESELEAMKKSELAELDRELERAIREKATRGESAAR